MDNKLIGYKDIIFYDFEVYKHYWCVVFNLYTQNNYLVIDDVETLTKFYVENKEKIFVGYNSRMYDLPIFKSVLGGLNPYKISVGIIDKHQRISTLIPKNIQDKYKINNYDAYDNQHSLKQLEAFIGMDIRETEVDFNIDRPLTPKEIEQTHFYCKHDVSALKEYFKIRERLLGSFESHAILIHEYNLPLEYFNKTGVQLTSIILDAKRELTIDDEFEFDFPGTIEISDKNKDIIEFYQKPENKSYRKIFASDKKTSSGWKREFSKKIGNIDCVYGFGGVHGSIDNLILENCKILIADVGSEYPNYMIQYNSISRKVSNANKFKGIVDKRLELKEKKDPKNKAFKPIINGTFGATKDKNNDMFDPRIANQITIGCQLLMSDLIEKVGDCSRLINVNTDGIYCVVENDFQKNNVLEICRCWQERTGLTLEFEEYNKIVQANVNNYIMIQNKPNGEIKYKAKGGMFKPKTPIDNDLAIVSEALINYFVYDIPVEKTINECNELIKFQKIIKLSDKYNKVVLGKTKVLETKKGYAQVIDYGTPLHEKVHRVFASNNINDYAIWKTKNDRGLEVAEKMPYTSNHVFIDNGDIRNKTCPKHLDKKYYIELVKDKINQITAPKKEIAKIDMSDFLFECMKNSSNYIEFLINVNSKYKPTNKAIRKYIIANCCEQYGKTKKLNDFIDYFSYFYGKKTITINNLNKKINNKEFLSIIKANSVVNKTGKSLSCDSSQILKEIFNKLPNEELPLKEILLAQADLFEEIRYIDKKLNSNLWLVQNYSNAIKPTVNIYQLSTGEIEYCHVDEQYYKVLPITDGDIIQVYSLIDKTKPNILPKTSNTPDKLKSNKEIKYKYLSKYIIIDKIFNSVNTDIINQL